MEVVNSRGYQLIGLPMMMDKDKGAVFKCRHNTGKEFAIKWINCEESDENEFNRLMREKVICLTLKHQNIVKFVEFFESPAINGISSHFYQVMELCRSDLKEWFKENKNRSLEMCDQMINEIISGLSYLHSNNIMHRDLKPRNVLISFDGICKLADFGCVKKHITSVTKAHTNAIGTELYAAPELRLSEESYSAVSEGAYNLKVDVYSLAIILVEFFTVFNISAEYLNAIQNFRFLGSIPEKFFENFDRNKNSHYFKVLKDLIVKMIKSDPKLRPHLNGVKQCFRDINVKTNEVKDRFDNIHLKLNLRRKIMKLLSTKYPVFNQIDSKLIEFSKFVFIYSLQNQYFILMNNENERQVYEIKVNKEFDTILGEKGVIKELSNKTIIDIECGYRHVMCLTEDSQVFAWGINSDGQLGNGTVVDNSIPTIVEKLNGKKIVSISCGPYHSLAMSSDGKVFAWGWNYCKRLGIDSNEERTTTPTLIQAFPRNNLKITAISCGGSHGLALTQKGFIFSWGTNGTGECGSSGHELKSVSRVKLENHIVIKKICCGLSHNLLLTSEGDVYSFGENDCGQLGRKTYPYYDCVATKIETSVKFTDIYTNVPQNIFIGLSQSRKCFVWGKCGEEKVFSPRETQFESINETFIFYSNTKIISKAIIF